MPPLLQETEINNRETLFMPRRFPLETSNFSTYERARATISAAINPSIERENKSQQQREEGTLQNQVIFRSSVEKGGKETKRCARSWDIAQRNPISLPEQSL